MKRKTRSINRPLWVIRAGLASAAHSLFVDEKKIVLMKQDMGDLRLLAKDRRAFYAAYKKQHAKEGVTAIKGIGGKFFRFIHEVQVGDFIIYPCRLDMKIYCGIVTSPYFYDNTRENDFPHARKVRWKGSFQKNVLSLFTRRELNTARTLFLLKRNVDEIRQQISLLSPTK